jgi:hypothetical protein
MNISKKLLVFFIAVFVMGAFCSCRSNTKKREAVNISGGDNIQVDIMIVVSEKDKEEKTYSYSLITESNQEIKWHQGSKMPYTTKASAKKGDENVPAKEITFVDVGTMISLIPFIDNGEIILKSNIEVAKVVSMAENGVPVIDNFFLKHRSVHRNSKFLKILSGDYFESQQTIDIYIKAVLVKENKKGKK